LNALTTDIAGNRRVLALARDLVDLVDVDDAGLGLFDIKVSSLDQLEEDVLDVLADIASFGQCRRVGHGERNVEHSRQRLREVRLAATGGTEEQDVALRQLDFVTPTNGGRLLVLDPPIVVVHRDGEDLLGFVLTNDVLVEERADLAWCRQLFETKLARLGQILVDALIADVDPRSSDELLDLLLRLTAERALEQFSRVTKLRHYAPFGKLLLGVAPERSADRTGAVDSCARRDHFVDDAIFDSGLSFYDEVAVRVLVDPLDRLAGVLGEDLLQQVAHPQDFLGSQLEVGDLSVADLAPRLVQQHTSMREGEALAFRAGGEQYGGRRRSLAEAYRGDVVLDELHRVVDREQRGDIATGAVDVDVDVLVRVLALQVDELSADDVGNGIVDGRWDEDDVLTQHARVEV
jgi:hypothetical protein